MAELVGCLIRVVPDGVHPAVEGDGAGSNANKIVRLSLCLFPDARGGGFDLADWPTEVATRLSDLYLWARPALTTSPPTEPLQRVGARVRWSGVPAHSDASTLWRRIFHGDQIAALAAALRADAGL